MKSMKPSISRNTTLTNIYERNLEAITKKILALHEDLQFDYTSALQDL